MRSAVAFPPKDEPRTPPPAFFYFDEALCMPGEGQGQHRYHWLAFVGQAGPDAYPFHADCELWRWHHYAWRSVMLPGASFTPREMFEQGWRYCGPCAAPAALIRS